jgi:hypothetical protein
LRVRCNRYGWRVIIMMIALISGLHRDEIVELIGNIFKDVR